MLVDTVKIRRGLLALPQIPKCSISFVCLKSIVENVRKRETMLRQEKPLPNSMNYLRKKLQDKEITLELLKNMS